MRTYTKTALFQIIVVSLLALFAFSLPVKALPPAMEADNLLKSVTDNLSKNNLEEAHKDFEKIKALKVELPTDFYLAYASYFVVIRQAGKAKKNLETYLNKAGKEGKFYDFALELYSHVEKNEKRWARFKYNGDGTVTDTKTGLMWASNPIYHKPLLT